MIHFSNNVGLEALDNIYCIAYLVFPNIPDVSTKNSGLSAWLGGFRTETGS